MPRIGPTAVLAGAMVCGAGTGHAAPTEPLSLTNPLTPWHNCSACHAFPNPPAFAGEPDIAPMAWQGSMMGNAARDPIFWAGVALAAQDGPGETEDCIRCHAPRAFLEGRGEAIGIDELLPDDLGGVSCDLCHRLVDDGVTPPGNAGYTVDDSAVKGLVPRRGPWGYQPGDLAPPHPWVEDVSHLGSARMCGTCHDVSTARERVDDAGMGLGIPFNEQRTYSEWLASDFAIPGAAFQSCQDCHMPRVQDVPGCEMSALQGVMHAEGRRHDLVGANRHMTMIVRELYGDNGDGSVPDFYFTRSIARIDELVQTAATLELSAPASVDVTQGIAELTVTVTNETGHKLPTGYAEGRVMWLEVTARYEGLTLWASGRWNEAEGIESDPQLRTYEGVAERYSDGAQLHLLRNDHWIVDSRIPPRGMTAGVQTDPVGDRYTRLGDGTWPHYDTVSYAFDPVAADDLTPGEPDLVEFQARLMYWQNTPEYIDVLVADNATNAAGNAVAELFDLYGAPEPIVLAQVAVVVPLVGLDAVAADDTAGQGSTDQGDGGATTSTSSGGADPGDDTSTGSVQSASDSTGASNGQAPGEGGCSCRAAPIGHDGLLWVLVPLLGRPRRRPQVRTASGST